MTHRRTAPSRTLSDTAPAISTTTLYRPGSQAEVDLIAASGDLRFPLRLPEQPIFYPVCNEEYATQIASRSNTAEGKVGYVTRFAVRSDFMAKYDGLIIGSRTRSRSCTQCL